MVKKELVSFIWIPGTTVEDAEKYE